MKIREYCKAEHFDKLRSYRLDLQDTHYTIHPIEALNSQERDRKYYVIEIDDCIAGFFVLQTGEAIKEYVLQVDSSVLFRSFSIDIDHRNKGIAKKALHHILHHPTFFKQTDHYLMLTVNTDNQKAKKIYESLGFQSCGEICLKKSKLIRMCHNLKIEK